MTTRGSGERRRWWGAFAVLGGLGTVWAFAVPVFAAPDEPAHVIRAVAAVDGQFLGDEFGPDAVPPYPVPVDQEPWKSGLAVRVPGVYREWGNVECIVFAWNAQRSADCLELAGPREERRALTNVGRYPPAYYLAIGAVAWVTPAGNPEVYAMRVVSALLCAALLASAVATLLSHLHRPVARLGLVVAITPMTLFLLGTVNANAAEVAAGLAVWVHGTVLATAGPSDRDDRVLDRLGVAAVVLVVSRPGSFVWLLLTLGVLTLVADRSARAAWWRWGRARNWAAAIIGVTVLQGAWFLVADTLDIRHSFIAVPVDASFTEDLRASLGSEFRWLREMIGVFGWLDTPAPSGVLVAWVGVLGALLATTFLVASRRVLVGTAVVFALCVVVPVAYQLRFADSVGYFWQGRYLLPFAGGLPVLAAVGAARGASPLPREAPFARSLAAVLLGAQWVALAQVLRRYSVGADGAIWFFTEARWSPPIPSPVLLFAAAALLVLAGRAVAATHRP